MIRHAALLLVFAWAAPVAALQAAPQDHALDRVRQALAGAGPLRVAATRADGRGRPVFRARVEELGPREGRLVWDPAIDTEVPSFVRPRWPGPHYEFLRVVTPEEFRASTTPAGIDVFGPGQSIVSVVRAARRRRAEEQARRRIKEELAALKKGLGAF